MITLNKVSVSYGENQILQDIDLFINPKDFIAFIGENGTGKTTLLKVLTGLLKPNEGYITYMNDLNMGYVPQAAAFDKDFPVNVEQVVLSGCLPKRMRLFSSYSAGDRKNCKNILEDFGLGSLRKRSLDCLSGGQLQKVLIARALISKPHILLLDEPTASIDQITTEEIFKLLKKISHEVTVVLVSHDTLRVKEYAHKVYQLDNMNIERIK